MSRFFVNYEDGRVATRTQLAEAGLIAARGVVTPPWHQIRGSIDANTMWYAVMVRRERGIFIGAVVFRHSDRHTLLLERGWRDVPVAEIGVDGPPAPVQPM